MEFPTEITIAYQILLLIVSAGLTIIEFLILKTNFKKLHVVVGFIIIVILNIFIYFGFRLLFGGYYTAVLGMILFPTVCFLKIAAYRFLMDFHRRKYTVACISVIAYCVLFHWASISFDPFNPTFQNLQEMIDQNKSDRFQFLLSISFYPANDSGTRSLLCQAIGDNRVDIINTCLAYGVNPYFGYPIQNSNPEIRWKISKWMMESGVTVKQYDSLMSFGPRLYMIALTLSNEDFNYCVKKGLNLTDYPDVFFNVLNNQNFPADDLKVNQTILRQLQLLEAAGVSFNHYDSIGFKPIHYAIVSGTDMTEVLEFLLTHGADANAVTKSELYENEQERVIPANQTPLRLASWVDGPYSRKYIELLMKYGGK